MGKLSANDEEQLEYIRKWHEMKEEQKREKARRKNIRNMHLVSAKGHFKAALDEFLVYLKLIFKRGCSQP